MEIFLVLLTWYGDDLFVSSENLGGIDAMPSQPNLHPVCPTLYPSMVDTAGR